MNKWTFVAILCFGLVLVISRPSASFAQSGCSSYTDQSSCESNGCVWNGGDINTPPTCSGGTSSGGGTTFGTSGGGGTTGGGSGQLSNPLSCPDLASCVKKVIDYLTIIAVPIVTIMVLYGGFLLMTSGGDPAKAKKGRDVLLYAAIGFVVILLANTAPALIKKVFGA